MNLFLEIVGKILDLKDVQNVELKKVEDSKDVVLFHGSPEHIKDTGMKAGTYFTDDYNVAKQYGKIVYKFQTDNENIGLFEKDIFNEHWISKRLIPFNMFEVVSESFYSRM